jgi:hypothetical protein
MTICRMTRFKMTQNRMTLCRETLCRMLINRMAQTYVRVSASGFFCLAVTVLLSIALLLSYLLSVVLLKVAVPKVFFSNLKVFIGYNKHTIFSKATQNKTIERARVQCHKFFTTVTNDRCRVS